MQQELQPIALRNIPFAITFGNHDNQAGISNAEQMPIYESYAQFVGGGEYAYGPGTYSVPIYDDAGQTVVFVLYLIDSGGDAEAGGYEPVSEDIIHWYRSERDRYAAVNGNQVVPALVFQHIPLPEYYAVLKRVKPWTRGAVRTFRTHKNELYVLPPEGGQPNDFFTESSSIPDINSGEFDAFSERGDVLGIYVGHDHGNSFVRKYRGIDLGYTQSSGFNEYGPGTLRGVRVIELDEENIRQYQTHTITFRQMFGRKLARPFLDLVYRHFPTSMDNALYYLPRYGLAALVAIGAIVGLIILL
ncbi:hypothetical protein LJC55_03650 [Eubacteriales bacterium OttesenSCG-928-N14]|nr:hypothetical protein [Eubacteriales bacterium OttesenSCG-928-N14]